LVAFSFRSTDLLQVDIGDKIGGHIKKGDK
jgi:hypothetical protein